MAAQDRLSFTVALAWLRTQVADLRRSILARHPALRWALLFVLLSGLTTAVYWTATSLNTVSVHYLLAGRRFSTDDLITVCRNLDKQGVTDYRIDDLRRVEVSSDQYDQATEVVGKLDLGLHSINELREESIFSSFFDTSSEREFRKHLGREKMVERLISQLDGVVWSLVSIHVPPARRWPVHQNTRPTAFVYIETEGKRRLPYQSVQQIPVIVEGYEPELSAGSITVIDTRGNKYFESGNVAIGVDSQNRFREQELIEEILQRLEWVKGVRVQVKVTNPRTPEMGLSAASATAAAAAHSPVATHSTDAARIGEGTSHQSGPGDAVAAMSVNQPTSLDADLAGARSTTPTTTVSGGLATTNEADVTSHGRDRGKDREKPQKPESGRVLVYVPSSFYLNANASHNNREPTLDEIRILKDRTENAIKTAIGLITPASEPWKVDIFTFPDEGSLRRPIVLESPAETRRRVLDWGIVGTVVAGVSILAAAGSWIKAARRPVVVPDLARGGRRYHVDSASESGPSDRVRELVRRNPEAAVSVLQRWTGQGGAGS